MLCHCGSRCVVCQSECLLVCVADYFVVVVVYASEEWRCCGSNYLLY